MSPFYTSIVGDGEPETRIWLVDLETTLAGLMLIASAAFSFLKFGKKWIYLVLSLISFAACLLFFLSLGGRGLGLGSQTQLGWGSTSTLMGITIMFFSSLAELISETAV